MSRRRRSSWVCLSRFLVLVLDRRGRAGRPAWSGVVDAAAVRGVRAAVAEACGVMAEAVGVGVVGEEAAEVGTMVVCGEVVELRGAVVGVVGAGTGAQEAEGVGAAEVVEAETLAA